jgi:prephenate dehydrogenase
VIQRLSIVGLGLMGGSLGLAARGRAGTARVVGWDPDPAAGSDALARGCVDETARDLAEAVAEAELVVLCAPVTELPSVLAELAALSSDATITDIGSTKSGVVAAVPGDLRPRFIGGHPIAGMETRGARNARAELFEGATWYLTPLAETEPAPARPPPSRGRARRHSVAVDAGVHDRLLAHEPPARTSSRTCSSCRPGGAYRRARS